MPKKIYSFKNKPRNNSMAMKRTHGFWIRLNALVTALIFFFSLLDVPPQAAAEGPAVETMMKPSVALKEIENPIFGVPIPEQWGMELSRRRGTNGKTVVFIQDLHGNYEAQQNVSRVLSKLSEKAPLAIAVEGASGPVDIRPVRSIKQKHVREEIADFFLSRGYFCGVEYLVSTDTDHDWKLFGIENNDLYLKNLHQYRRQIQNTHEVQAMLSILDEKIENLAGHALNDRLKAFRKSLWKKWEDLGKLIPYIAGQARKAGLQIGKQIQLKLKQARLEKKLDIPRPSYFS